MHLASPVPDSSTIWLLRDQLHNLDMVKVLFDLMNAQLLERGVIVLEGQAIYASFVDAPRRRNSREENATIKADEVSAEWERKPHKLRQKDTDARKKGEEVHCGYKNHLMSDVESKLITEYEVSATTLHDNQMLDILTGGGLAVNLLCFIIDSLNSSSKSNLSNVSNYGGQTTPFERSPEALQ